MHFPIGTILMTCLLAAPPLLAAGPSGSKIDPVKTKAKTDGRAQTIAEAWNGSPTSLVTDVAESFMIMATWGDEKLLLPHLNRILLGPLPHPRAGQPFQEWASWQDRVLTCRANRPSAIMTPRSSAGPSTRWCASTDTSLRKATQGIYNHQVRTLARVHFKVWQAINHDPKWRTTEAALYQASIAKGYEDHMMHIDHYHDTLGHAASNWGDNDPNTVRTATMWWVRRSIDGTADLWSEGLLRLLRAYDGAWLDSKLASPTGPAPAQNLTDRPSTEKATRALTRRA